METNLVKKGIQSIYGGLQMLPANYIELARKYSIKNGNKLTNKNWHKLIAISNTPCTNVKGVLVIDNEIKINGAYFEKWSLKFEPKTHLRPAGYIFREVNHNGGISGIHDTYKEAVWSALRSHITVWLVQ